MEDYINIIIYAIIAIIGLASSAMNKKRKREQAEQNVPVYDEEEVDTKSSDNYFFSDFIDSITHDATNDEPLVAEEDPYEFEEEAVAEEIELITEKEPEEDLYNPIYDNEIGENGKKEFTFDLEEAVIYSALLNTKHF